jgi:hypothetical protein
MPEMSRNLNILAMSFHGRSDKTLKFWDRFVKLLHVVALR